MMKTRSTRVKEYPPYENMIKKTSAGKYAVFFIITGAIIATIVSIGTGRPELFYICTIVAIIGSTALITSIPVLNSITIAAFPIYVVVVPLTIIGGDWMSIIHFSNLFIIIAVIVLSGKRVQPLVIMASSVFYIFYGIAFLISVPPEYGVLDPYNQAAFVTLGMFTVISIMTIDLAIAFILKSSRNVGYMG